MRHQRSIFLAPIVATAFVLGACNPKDEPTVAAKPNTPVSAQHESQSNKVAQTAADPRVERAAAIAIAISAEPANADAILEKHGIDRDELETMMYEIAEDPELRDEYAKARAGGIDGGGQE